MKMFLAEYQQVLRRYLAPQRGPLWLMGLLLVGSIGLQLLGPQAVRRFIDSVQRGESESALIWTALLFLAITFAQQVLRVSASYNTERVAWTATNALRADLVDHVLRLDITFHQTHSPGELIERIDGDVNALAGFFSDFVLQLIGSAILLIGIVAAVAWINLWLGLIMAAFVLITLGALGWVWRRGVSAWEADREHNSAFFGFIGEVLTALEDLKSNGGTAYVFRRFFAQLQAWLPVRLRSSFWGQSVMVTAIFAAAVSTALVYGVGGHLFFAGALNLGQVYVIIAYAAMLDGPIETLRTQLQGLQQASASLNRIRGLLETRSKIVDGARTTPTEGALPLTLSFDRVCFRYDDGATAAPANWTLSDVSFTLAAGKTLGVVGHTGSGKTTLARLIFRQYDPQQGVVRLGSTDLREFTLDVLRTQIAWVTQEVQLLDAPLRDNLTFFQHSVSDEQIVAVLNLLGLGSWFERLERGLDTVIRISDLSAGEAQLIALARAFIRNPRLVILDEASSRLDPNTQALTDRALDVLLKNRSAIIIAHRLDTLDRADEILLLEAGRVIEHGPRDNPHSEFKRLRRKYENVGPSGAPLPLTEAVQG